MVTFQLDGALLHRSEYMNVSNLSEPPNWPSNSHFLNPISCINLGTLLQLLYHQQIKDIDCVKQDLNICWDTISVSDYVQRAYLLPQKVSNTWKFWDKDVNKRP